MKIHIPVWAWWVMSVALGVLCGWLSKECFRPSGFWTWKTLWMVFAAGVGAVWLWWAPAPEYDPFQAGLTPYILTSVAIAFVTALVWALLNHRRRP